MAIAVRLDTVTPRTPAIVRILPSVLCALVLACAEEAPSSTDSPTATTHANATTPDGVNESPMPGGPASTMPVPTGPSPAIPAASPGAGGSPNASPAGGAPTVPSQSGGQAGLDEPGPVPPVQPEPSNPEPDSVPEPTSPALMPEPVTPEPDPTPEPTPPVAEDRTETAVCDRWNADRDDLFEGTWSGNVAGCEPGDISEEGRSNALAVLNLYRWLADLPAVATDPDRDALAQACALMMDANNSLSHEPPQSWDCWTEDGSRGASTSNISGGPGVESIDLYLWDNGNESTMGHRRIILSNSFGPVGLGSTGPGGSSCMQNNDGSGDAEKDWVAWPPPGNFPLQAYDGGWTSLANTGWSVQSQDMDIEGATVTVSSDGMSLDVDVEDLTGNYGNTQGIRIVPNGWDVEVGQAYSVTVGDTIAYEFTIIDCD